MGAIIFYATENTASDWISALKEGPCVVSDTSKILNPSVQYERVRSSVYVATNISV